MATADPKNEKSGKPQAADKRGGGWLSKIAPGVRNLVAKRETVDVARTRKLLAAIAEATTWLKTSPQEAWALFAKAGKENDNELNRLAWKDTVPLLATDPAALDRARYQTFADFLVKRGLIKQAPPLDSYLREIK